MKLHNFICFNISVLITLLNLCLPSKSQTPQQVSQKPRITFVCKVYQNVPTIVAKTEGRTIPILGHTSSYFSVSGYDPSTRCDIISGRFQKLHDFGQLNFITSGKVENLLVICGVGESNQLCSRDNILFTLPSGSTTENSKEIIYHLFSTKNYAASNPIYDSDFSVGLHGDPTTPPPPPPVKPFIIVDHLLLDEGSF